jgi:hypothetical protein
VEQARVPGRWLPGHGRALVLLVLALLSLPACAASGSRPGAGDPGGRRLHQLSTDPVFTALPRGAAAKGPPVKTPARYRAPGFQPGGWDGPSVALTFTSPRPPASVFAFVQGRAQAAGWRPANRNALGYPQTWDKTYPDGVPATLSLIQTVPTARGGTGTYVLTASAPPAVST